MFLNPIPELDSLAGTLDLVEELSAPGCSHNLLGMMVQGNLAVHSRGKVVKSGVDLQGCSPAAVWLLPGWRAVAHTGMYSLAGNLENE